MLSKIIFLRFFSKFLMDDISYDKTAFLSRDLFLSSIFAEHNNSFVQLFNFTTSTLNVCLGTEKFTSIFIIHQLCTFFFNHCPTSDLYLSLRNIWFLIIRLSWFHTFFVNLWYYRYIIFLRCYAYKIYCIFFGKKFMAATVMK